VKVKLGNIDLELLSVDKR